MCNARVLLSCLRVKLGESEYECWRSNRKASLQCLSLEDCFQAHNRGILSKLYCPKIFIWITLEEFIQSFKSQNHFDCTSCDQCNEKILLSCFHLNGHIHRLNSENHLVHPNKQHHEKALLRSFHLNGHMLRFHPQTQKLQPPCTAPQESTAQFHSFEWPGQKGIITMFTLLNFIIFLYETISMWIRKKACLTRLKLHCSCRLQTRWKPNQRPPGWAWRSLQWASAACCRQTRQVRRVTQVAVVLSWRWGRRNVGVRKGLFTTVYRLWTRPEQRHDFVE